MLAILVYLGSLIPRHSCKSFGQTEWENHVKEISSCIDISDFSVETILKIRLHLIKVCTKWVSHLLDEETPEMCPRNSWKYTKAAIIGVFLTY